MIYEIAARTETGPVRERNEDHLLVGDALRNRGWLALTLPNDDEQIIGRGLLLAVADGMGGAAGGQVASRLALEGLLSALNRTIPPGGSTAIGAADLDAAMRQANTAVRERQVQDPGLAGMGTTLSGILLTAAGYWVLHVGDSRILRIRNRFIRPLTRDDNLAEQLIAEGVSAAAASANPEADALTSFIGADQMRPTIAVGATSEVGDYLLICSDGLHAFLEEEAILACLGDEEASVRQMVDRLIDAAIAAGSNDNLSVILVRIQEPETLVPEDEDEPR